MPPEIGNIALRPVIARSVVLQVDAIATRRDMMKPVLIRQHLESAPPGTLGTWLDARGLAYEISCSWRRDALPDPDDYAFVASLGHDRGAHETGDPGVAAERELLTLAVERDVPVLGLCYGGQVLAAVLGAQVGRAAMPELGWREIETDDPGLVPAGPWLEWHYDCFSTPPGATEIARTADASQAFRLGPHLGVQFHPEATVDIVGGWARADAARLGELGIADAATLLRAARARRIAAEAAAYRLFDAFADQLR
jgi:GMP synthase-like glutamine amidotransferase